MTPTDHNSLSFAEPEVQQPIYRALLGAMSYPGRLHAAPAPAGVADVVVTLVDRQVSLADPYGTLPSQLWRWLGVSQAPADEAQYIICPGQDSPDFQPQLGTLESPEFGATVIIPVPELSALKTAEDSSAEHLYVAGPSHKNPKVRGFRAKGMNGAWLQKRASWQRGFPLGTDWIFVAPGGAGQEGEVVIAAVPRSCALATDWSELAAFADDAAASCLAQKKERLDP